MTSAVSALQRHEGFGKWQRPNGLWVGSIELPADATTGKRRRKIVSSMDEKKLDGLIRKRIRELEDHGDLPTATMSLSKWMDYWLDSIDKSRPSTRAGYRSKIEHYIKPAIGRVKLDQLNQNDVRRLERFIVVDKGRSPTSALQTYQILAKALKDAERDGRVIRNVARLVDPPRKAFYRADVLTPAEARTVLSTVEDDRLRSRWAIALLTGMRQGEVLGLEIDRVSDVIDLSWQLQRIPLRNGKLDAPPDWEHRHLHGSYYLSRPKSRAGWRVIPAVGALRSALEERIAEAEKEPNPFGLVWTADPKKQRGGDRALKPLDGLPIDPSVDSKAWHSILARAGVPDMRLHDARHTAVTVLYDLGVPEVLIQQIVGQSTVSVTRNYRHQSAAQLAQAMARLGEAMTTGRLSLER